MTDVLPNKLCEGTKIPGIIPKGNTGDSSEKTIKTYNQPGFCVKPPLALSISDWSIGKYLNFSVNLCYLNLCSFIETQNIKPTLHFIHKLIPTLFKRISNNSCLLFPAKLIRCSLSLKARSLTWSTNLAHQHWQFR